MQRKTPNLLTVRTIGEYLKMEVKNWPYSLTELERLQRAAKVLTSLGFSSTYKMSYNVVHWSPVVASLSNEFASAGQHTNFIWLCNKIASLLRKHDFSGIYGLALGRGSDVSLASVNPQLDVRKVTWTNEKTNATFTVGYQVLS